MVSHTTDYGEATQEPHELRVLLLEDNPGDVRLVQELLQERDRIETPTIKVTVCDTLQAALGLLANEPFDAVLLDLSLPDSDGLDTVRRMVEAMPDIPVVVVAGLPEGPMALEVLRAGAQDYVPKAILEDNHTAPVVLRWALRRAIERARMLAERRETEQQLRFQGALLGAVGQAVIATDPAGNVTYWNRAAERLYGWTAAEALGRNIGELTVPTQNTAEGQAIRGQLLRGQSWAGEFRVRRRDGSTFLAFVTDMPLYDTAGKLSGVIGISTDITARVQAEQRLRDSEALARALLEHSSEAITITDATGKNRYVSPSVTHVLGYTPEEMVAAAPFSLVDPQERGRAKELMERLISEPGSTIHTTWRIRHKDGSWRWVEGTGKNLLDEPLVQAIVTNFHDVTATKEAGLRLEETNKRLEVANRRLEEAYAELETAQQQIVQQERLRALGEMAAGIAHDLNNALAPVVGFSELLAMGAQQLTAQQREWLSLVRTGAVDAAEVVGRLREFYRPRSSDEVYEAVDLAALVARTLALTRPKWKDEAQATGRTIEVVSDLQATLPVAGHEPDLREALINLVFNAVDAMPQGGQLTIFTRDCGARVLLAVRDTGTGMTEEARRRCLEPFFSTKGERGTGLGLSMVHGIVQRHHGQLDIFSAPGQGTTMQIALPVDAAEPAAVLVAKETEAARRLRLLVVDDEPSVRAATAAMAEAGGHEVETASSGAEALESLLARPYDVVFTDRAMPGMSGEQLATLIKQHAPTLPVILLTGYGDLMNTAGERPVGVDVIVGKPITLARFNEAVKQVLGEHTAAGR